MDFRALIGVGLLGCAAACGGGDDNRSAPPTGDAGVLDADPPIDASSDGAHGAGVLTGPCEGNKHRECSYDLPESFGVAGCFIGAQACVNGTWGPCVKAEWLPAATDSGVGDAEVDVAAGDAANDASPE